MYIVVYIVELVLVQILTYDILSVLVKEKKKAPKCPIYMSWKE